MSGENRRRHPDRALTAVRVRQLKKPGRHADGGGLYLLVDQNGAKRWVLRTVVQGRRRDIGLGSARLVSLVEAREQAGLFRKTARSGRDPIADYRSKRKTVPTFAEAARIVHEQHARSWRNAKHAAQWLSTLERFAFPHLGNRPVDDVESADVLRVLTPIWHEKPETARRVRQRIRAVFDWAKGAGHRLGDNPVDGLSRVLLRQTDEVQHFAAMPYAEVADFLRRLRDSDAGEIPKLAFEFTILTAARTGEVVGARWDEFDLENAIWIVPASRAKTRRAHRIPLAPRVMEILRGAKELASGSEFVFPGRSPQKHLSNMAFLMILRRMAVPVTAHGFRSSFRDWSAERTNFSREAAEMALAHAISSDVEAAYRRGDLLEKRRVMMADWAKYIEPEKEA